MRAIKLLVGSAALALMVMLYIASLVYAFVLGIRWIDGSAPAWATLGYWFLLIFAHVAITAFADEAD